MKLLKDQFRGIRADTGTWAYGDLITSEPYAMIRESGFGGNISTVRAETIGRNTGKNDRKGNKVFEGDIIKGNLDILMTIRFGTYPAYCPVDKEYMDSVGFYAEIISYDCPLRMPIGPLEMYAEVVGDVYHNPELLVTQK